MSRSREIPLLIEQFMDQCGTDRCQVTVREIREYFRLDDSAGPAIAGFLQKISQDPFFSFQYKVSRIEKFRDTVPPYRIIRRYCIEKRPDRREQGTAGQKAGCRSRE